MSLGIAKPLSLVSHKQNQSLELWTAYPLITGGQLCPPQSAKPAADGYLTWSFITVHGL